MFTVDDLPCPKCGQYTVIGYSYHNENGEHMHTRYRCTFWKSGINRSTLPRTYDRTEPCDWDGWSVPGHHSDEEAAEQRAFAETKRLTPAQEPDTVPPMTNEDTLHLGGMTLRRDPGGVNVEPRFGGATGVRLQAADLDEIAHFLRPEPTTDPSNDWYEAGDAADYAWYLFRTAKTPLDQAEALVMLSNKMHDLRTFLPGYDYESGTLPWEREDDE